MKSRKADSFVLLLVLVIIMLASMVVTSLMFMLTAEQTASTAGIHGEQAWTTAMSGVYQAMRIAAASDPGSTDWRDNPSVFRDQQVFDDGANKWFFSVYSCGGSDTSEIRYGLTDESSKVNACHAETNMLEMLPNMTATLAQALIEYVRANDKGQPAGNGGLDATAPVVSAPVARLGLSCLDELLQAPGFNGRLLYGEDANFNGRLDPNEDDGDTTWPPDDKDGKLDMGLQQYLTICSYDLNIDNQGRTRLNLNDTNADLTSLELSDAVKNYLAAWRTNSQPIGHAVELLDATNKFKNKKGVAMEMVSGVTKADLAILLDRCTATNQNRLSGLINLNTASVKVMAALPGVSEALAESIVSARVGLSPESRQTTAWLYAEGLVNADLFKKIAPYLTTRSYQFHFQVLAYAVPSGNYRMLEAVVDVAAKPPTILSLRDMTRLGLPFNITPSQDQNSGAIAYSPDGRGKIAKGRKYPGRLMEKEDGRG